MQDPAVRCTEGWVGPSRGMDAQEKRKFSCLCWGWNYPSSVVSASRPVTILTAFLAFVHSVTEQLTGTWPQRTMFKRQNSCHAASRNAYLAVPYERCISWEAGGLLCAPLLRVETGSFDRCFCTTETWCVGARSTKHEAVHIKGTKFCFRPSTEQVKIAVPHLNVSGVTSDDTEWVNIRIFSEAVCCLRNKTEEWNGEMEWRLE